MRMKRRIRRSSATWRADGRGAILPIVAILATVLLAMGALAVDLGNGWVTRRNLVTATDAGARAAAQEYANGGVGCDAVAIDWVQRNADEAINIVCDPNLGEQYVTVDAEANVETWFARLIGLNDFNASSSSTVRWGAAVSATGLRPIALCENADGIEDWLADTSISLTVTVPFFNKDGQPEECNGDGQGNNVEGNWGVLDYDGAGGQSPKDMVDDGYDGEVIAGDPDATCATDPASCYQTEPGNITQLKQSLEGIVGQEIFLPIVNYVVDASGSNVDWHIIGFASLTIDSLNLTGAASQRSITITFNPGFITGTCCSTTGGPNNVNVIQACAVDRKEIGSCSS